MMKLARAALLLTLASSAVWAQTNVGEQQAEATLPFQLTTTVTFELPSRSTVNLLSRMESVAKLRSRE